MAADPDEASSALIARLLQEDSGGGMFNPTYGGYGFDDDFSDDEEEKPKRKRKKATKKKKNSGTGPQRKRTKTATKKENDSKKSNANVTGDGNGGDGKKFTPRRWTDEEEKLFLEGLELYGRNWRKISEHLGASRDHKNVASHAQKHFIKLYRDDKPLPDKVRESGEGYTLSGKPLDPNSAAGRAYGALASGEDSNAAANNGKSSARAINDMLLAKAREDGSIDISSQVRPGETRGKTEENIAKTEEEQRQTEAEREQMREVAEKEKLLQKKRKKAEEWEKKQAACRHLYDDNGMTAYSRGRSRRHAKKRFIDASDELSFVPCAKYHGEPGSTDPLSQPFKVSVHSNVYALVDLHSHLSTAEVMGFLAGNWDAEAKEIEVVAAYPGRSVVDGATECEMDPVVEVEVRSIIEGQGLKVVGWYHSHPTFEAIPSKCDIDNQSNYQALFRDGKNGTDPFIGLIDSPFDCKSDLKDSPESKFAWFFVESPQTSKKAMHIDTELLPDKILPSDVKERMCELVKTKNSASSKFVKFDEIWQELPSGTVTYLEKTKKSLERFLSGKDIGSVLS